MLSYALKRLVLTIPTLIGVAVVIFFALRVVPGDIVEVKLKGDTGKLEMSSATRAWKSS